MKLLLVFMVTILFSFPAQSENTTATGTSRTFNPAISVNGLFLGVYNSEPLELDSAFNGILESHENDKDENEHNDSAEHGHGLPSRSGIRVQEVEIRMSAVVDAYLVGDVTFAIPGTEGLELEEGFVETTSLPNVSIKAGKFFLPVGKHNLLHTHAYPFLDPPMAQERILGGEGLNEIGLEASALLPTNWYSELIGVVVNGDNERFNSPDENDLAYFGRSRNLWDLDDDTTLELGGSFGIGKNEHLEFTKIISGDFTLKWWPARRNRDRGLTLQAEYLQARVREENDEEVIGGIYAFLQLQTARSWWIEARYDGFGFPRLSGTRAHRYSTLLAFVPSEFSALRFQYSLNRVEGESVHQIGLQLSFTMGSHPAHAY